MEEATKSLPISQGNSKGYFEEGIEDLAFGSIPTGPKGIL